MLRGGLTEFQGGGINLNTYSYGKRRGAQIFPGGAEPPPPLAPPPPPWLRAWGRGCWAVASSGGLVPLIVGYVSLGTAGTYPGYGPVYRNVPWWLFDMPDRTLFTLWTPYPDCPCSVHYLCRNIWNTLRVKSGIMSILFSKVHNLVACWYKDVIWSFNKVSYVWLLRKVTNYFMFILKYLENKENRIWKMCSYYPMHQ